MTYLKLALSAGLALTAGLGVVVLACSFYGMLSLVAFSIAQE